MKSVKSGANKKKINSILEWLPISLSILSIPLSFLIQISFWLFIIAITIVTVVIGAIMILGKLHKDKLDKEAKKKAESEHETLKDEHGIITNMAQIVSTICNEPGYVLKTTPLADYVVNNEAANANTITIFATDLTYDLNYATYQVLKDNILRGVKYKYLIENRESCVIQMQNLYNGLMADVDKDILLQNLSVYLVDCDKFLFNFLQIKNQNGYLFRFYFIKTTGRNAQQFVRISLDGHPKTIDNLSDVLRRLQNAAILVPDVANIEQFSEKIKFSKAC